VVNQWGRDGNFSSGSSRSGGAGILIAAVVALIIGAGGGYAGARFFSGVSSSAVAARDRTIADLNQALRKTKTDVQSAGTRQTALQTRVKDLEAQVTSLQHTKDSLRKYIDQHATAADTDAQAEIAALKKTIEDAGDLSGKLNRAQKSLKVSELQIIELEKTVSDQKAEIDKLQRAADQAAGHVNPAIAVLQAQKDTLETQLADAKSEAGEVPALKSRISALEDQLTKRAEDADAEARQQIATLQKQKDALQAKLDAALKAAGNADQSARKVAELQKQLDDMAERLADRDQVARDAAQSLKQAKADFDKSQQQLKTLKAQNDALGNARNDLAKQVASLNAAIAKLKAATAPVEDKPVTSNDSQDKNDQGGLTPRNRGDVEKAVADLPGYDNLSSDKQETLIGMLEKGECVTDSLKAAYGHVSPISLSRLFRDLGGHC
jgi:chromosome segregation ATPase